MSLGLRELLARTPRLECPFCGEPRQRKQAPKKNSRKRFRKTRSLFFDPEFFLTCGDEICKAAYLTFYKRDQRHPEAVPVASLKVSRAEKRRRMAEGQRRRWAQESHP